jgi:polyhydroxybutyrate depolymerase
MPLDLAILAGVTDATVRMMLGTRGGLRRRCRRLRHGLRLLLAPLVCAIALVGCGSSATAPRAGPLPPPQGTIVSTLVATTGCGKPTSILPGTSAEETIRTDGRTRAYLLHLPTGYGTSRSQALVLAFHGHSGSDEGLESYTGLSLLADRGDFIADYPQGTLGPHGATGWTTSGTNAVTVTYDPMVHDALFVSDLLTYLQATLCVDAHRIYATGWSNGGGMAGLLACALAGRVAAVAPVDGAFPPIADGCHPQHPISILEFHGTADPLVPYTGDASMLWPPISEWLAAWAQRDGCGGVATTFVQNADVVGEQWTGCVEGAVIRHYRIAGGGHTWPGASTTIDPSYFGKTTHTITATDLIWQFFQAHPLPGA